MEESTPAGVDAEPDAAWLHVDPDGTTPLELTVDAEEAGVHEDAADLLAIHYGVSLVLELLTEHTDEELRAAGYEPQHIKTLEQAFQAGEHLMDSPAYEAVLQDGTEAVDGDLRDELAEKLVPLGSVFGIDPPLSPASVADVADQIVVDAARWS